MKIFDKILDVQEYIHQKKLLGKTIGFVPTMGALHEGHLTLVRKSLSENDYTVVSIFVNPIQFNNSDDLEKYPRNISLDSELLTKEGTNILFTPTVSEMYPEPVTDVYDFGNLEKVMEGAFRPGHFNGVAVVVNRLFEIIMPDKAYFGEKDYQQLVIIKALVDKTNKQVEIVPCPISREPDGLARSSRNARLNTKMRKAAPFIFSELLRAKSLATKLSAEELELNVAKAFEGQNLLKLEYFKIADGDNLQPVKGSIKMNDYGFIAVFADDVRLIDNIRLI